MLKTNRRSTNIKEKVGDLMILSDTSTKIMKITDNEETLVYHLVSAYEILDKQLDQLDPASKCAIDISRKGQALRSITNALELLSVHNKQRLSLTASNLPPSKKEMETFLRKWRKKNPTSL